MKAKAPSSAGGRFGCGFVVGVALVLGFTTGTAVASDDLGGLLFMGVIGLMFGVAAMLFGEDFWRWFSKWLG